VDQCVNPRSVPIAGRRIVARAKRAWRKRANIGANTTKGISVRKLGVEPSRTVILRIPGEWWREFNTIRGRGTMGGILREALEEYLKRAGKLG